MHKLLERQLRRHFGDLAHVPPGLEAFLASVEASYEGADQDRALLERSLVISSEELVRHNIELLQRESDLACANAKLRELDQFRTRFINMAAHELGTPLTPMKIQLFLLKSRLEANPHVPPADRLAMEILARNTERLAGLVGDILDSAKLQGNHLGLKLGPVDIGKVVVESAQTFHAIAQRSGVHLEIEAEDALHAQTDARRLAQVMTNLLSNAMKFTPSGGFVRIRMRQEGANVLVAVADSGAGIPSEKIAQLFAPFAQVHDTTDATKGGTGLGLYISKGIIEGSGGKLWCESPGAGRGTTFLFSLPLLSDRPLSATTTRNL